MLKNMSGVKKKEPVSNELIVLHEEASSVPRLVGASEKRLSDQIRALLQPPQVSISNLTNSSLDQALLQNQMLQLLGHSAASPFQSPLNMRQGMYRLNTSFQPPNATEIILNRVLQQRISRLSAAQIASLQLAAASPNTRVSAEPALLRLQQKLNNGFV